MEYTMAGRSMSGRLDWALIRNDLMLSIA
jgi:hypothetical protein